MYLNPSNVNPQEESKGDEKPIEVNYRFPKKDEDVISAMKITVGDKTIEAKVMEKEKA